MLMTLTFEPDPTTDVDASVLGYLVHKHPGRVQSFPAPVGDIHVFYPEVSRERCTIAVLLEVDAVGLAREKRFRGDALALSHYVNDRPYAASSMFAVALGAVFRTAMTGRSDSYPELASAPIPLRIELPVISTRGAEAEGLVRRLFEPLGWAVEETPIPLDPEHPEWGASRYSSLVFSGRVLLSHALRQLYVLLPVHDDAKHYWVGDDEVAKLTRAGDGWLAEHPERELITRRYLAHQSSLVSQADGAPDDERATGTATADPGPAPLRASRAEAVLRALSDVHAHRVVDMGCGPGALLTRLAKDRSFTEIVGTDVSVRALESAERTLNLRAASDAERERIRLLHGSVVYRDERVRGFDAVVLMEVVEHVDESRLPALEDAVFAHAAPANVVVTTPNADYNALYASLPAGRFRHDDHRFEWTRGEFRSWASSVAERNGYDVEFRPVGAEDPTRGSPTQLALFRRRSS
ncbi:3' terminal RNA ribose 2'-O-methyltransferase Hen1 [Labedella endophytica]|uniref:Small RNA 2'-O-methyltransferase n=1 Tax=Labedella endophytica TaxID=1523160 RepID=A0A3S0X7C7_9MICO|nr:3' terminal RNA ribose 2'-O-methyltransferase Hen1 [Labedella endophytica]RUQ96786.1 3' terminal RNA ribose 2'-O-methyltransferase Hen1 [Labedella endophytica]